MNHFIIKKTLNFLFFITCLSSLSSNAFAGNILDTSLGADITYITSAHRDYPSDRLLDSRTSTSWISRQERFTNDIIFKFDNDFSQYCFDKFRLFNYSSQDNRAIKKFLLFTSDDKRLSSDTGMTGWEQIDSGSSRSSGELNLISRYEGGILTDYTSEDSRHPARGIHDDDINEYWRSEKNVLKNTLEFSFEGGNAAKINTLRLYNYLHDDGRGIRKFQVLVKQNGMDVWEKLASPGGKAGAADYNFLEKSAGGTLVKFTSEHDSYPADRLNDGDTNQYWLSARRVFNNSLEYAFDADGDGATGDLINIDALKLYNYSEWSDRGVKKFQVEVKNAGSSAWQKVPVPGSAAGTPGFNFLAESSGGDLTSYTSQLSTSNPASFMNDAETNQDWISERYIFENNFFYAFDTDADGNNGDLINIDSVRLWNYDDGSSRGIKEFQLAVQENGSSTWKKVNKPGSAAGDAGYNFLSKSRGGRLMSYSSQHDSYPASRLNDSANSLAWLSSRNVFDNTLEYAFDTNDNGVVGDIINIDSIRLYNYPAADSRGIKEFQIEVHESGISAWRTLTLPDDAANYNFLRDTSGGKLTDYTSQFNSTYAANNLNDGDTANAWYSDLDVFDNTLEFAFDTDADGSTGDKVNFDSFTMYNYGSNRSVKDFQVEVKYEGRASWDKLPVPGTSAGASGFNFASRFEGGTLVNNPSERSSSNPASRMNDTDFRNSWISARGKEDDFEYRFDTDNDGNTGDLINFEAFKLYSIDSDEAIRRFELEYKQEGGSWESLGDFTAERRNSVQTWNFTPISRVSDVRLSIKSNYGDRYVRCREIEIIGDAVGESHTFTAADDSGLQSWALGKTYQNIVGVRLRTMNNYNDDYVGAREFEILGKSEVPISKFTALNMDGWQSWAFSPSLNNIDGLRFKTLTNYGDPNYIGAVEFEALGKSVGPSKVFEAENKNGWQSWTIDPPLADIKNMRFSTNSNHGDSEYIGAREFEVLGKSVSASHDFIAENKDGWQTWSLSPSLTDITGLRFNLLSNYGDDTYIGAKEFAVLGKSISAGNDFIAENIDGWQTWVLDTPVEDIVGIRFDIITNYGDTDYVGAREIEVLGSSEGKQYVFTADEVDAWQTFSFPAVDGNLFRIKTLSNYGDQDYIGANEVELNGISQGPCITSCELGSFVVDAGQVTSALACPDSLIPVTITAKCTNNSTKDDYEGAVSLSPSSANGGSFHLTNDPSSAKVSSVSFTAADKGSKTVYFSYNNENPNVVVSVSGDGKSGASAGIDFKAYGFKIDDVADSIACTAPASYSITAWGKLTDSDVKCQQISGFSGYKDLKFWFDYESANTSGSSLYLTPRSPGDDSAVPLLPVTPPTSNVTVNFQAGTGSFKLNYNDVGKLRLHAQYDDASYNMVGDSNIFTIRPKNLLLKAMNAAGTDLDNASSGSGVTHRAGEKFKISVQGVCEDGATVTPNYKPTEEDSNAHLFIRLARTGPLDPASLDGALSFANKEFAASLVPADFVETLGISAADFSSGEYLDNNASYNEVGLLNLQVKDKNYFGQEISSQPGGLDIGRFTPHHYSLTDNSPILSNAAWACDFTYLDQSFTIKIEPLFTITAHARDHQVTKNYGGDFWKIMTPTLPSITAGHYSDQAGAGNSSLSVSSSGNILLDSASASDFDGIGTFSLSGAGFKYSRPTSGQQTKFNGNFDFTFSSDDLTDSDGVFFLGESSDMDSASGETYTINLSGNELRHGRIKIYDNFGAEKEEIVNSLFETQYWQNDSGSWKWLKNAEDSCSGSIVIDPSSRVSISSSPQVISGAGSITVTGDASTAPVTARPDSPAWLNCPDCSSGCCGTFSYGFSRGNDRILNWKEILR